jgi:uncharacterized protein YyaL (SSP411 family)
MPRSLPFLAMLWVVPTLFDPGGHVYGANNSKEPPPNRLIHEKSPYLLQHARNPVDWYSWGEEAFQKAIKEEKPIFLSIGYATCHWCHVMAHESFEDSQVAQILNEHFVAIKVDREERPDVDKIYMFVCQSLTGHGGWPLSVFLTPERKPFFAGTYFPKSGRMGMPGFVDVLQQIAAMWENDRAGILKSSEAITQAIQPSSASGEHVAVGAEEIMKKGFSQLARVYDPNQGGFGAAPKFPTPHNLTFLLRWHHRNGDALALDMAEKTLDAMRNGGLFDQVGFGFHRYSVDQKWLVPHFEKMLYDQALLAMAYTEAYHVTKKERFAKVAHEIFTYVLRDMTDPHGGFYSAEDADSEGKEGIFYVWTPQEVIEHLGEAQGDLFCRYFDITDTGNFEEHQSIPHVRMSLERFAQREGMDSKKLEGLLEKAREKLFQVRRRRIHPLKDDKILTSWNGLMIAALAKASQVFGTTAYADAAEHAADFVFKHLKTKNGRLLRRFRKGQAAYPAYLDDYAFMVWGLIESYEATFRVFYLEKAMALNSEMLDIFWDEKGGGLFFTGKGNEQLITQSKELYDGALPSGNSVAAMNLMRLSRMTGNIDLEKKAEQLLQAFAEQVTEQPMTYTQFLGALDFMIGPSQEVVVVGDTASKTTQAMIQSVRSQFLPNTVLLVRSTGSQDSDLTAISPFVGPMTPVNGQPTAYVCEQYVCKKPIVNDAGKLESVLQ